MYDVSDHLPVGELRPGTNLLLTGPQGVGKYDLLCDLLATGVDRGQHAVVVSTNKSAPGVRADVSGRTATDTPNLAVVDCVSQRRDEPTPPDPNVQYVASPSDFSSMGMAASEFLERAGEGDGATRLGLHSLSKLLLEADVKTVFRFTHILTGRLSGVEGLGVATLDDNHDQQTMNTLRQLFDGVVETRQGLDSRECRVAGVAGTPTEWTGF
ncbi:RAD55 family ATPase [Haloarchaeobius baliensis]|uniref:RAD55 family ATPase n=1 Tax=Haloarchaeobius baliensis TaxID=1670458 RepID=UPI003F881A98